MCNADVFVWLTSDMTRIPPKVITNKLNIDPKHKPVQPKKGNFTPERQKDIDEKVDKLLATKFIRKVYYSD